MALAVGTSLAVIALTSASGLAGHLVSGSVDWSVALAFTGSAFTGAAVAGSFAGTALGARVPATHLRQAFGVFLLAVAGFLLWETS
jgi:uncharacterized membrane protein YfcA